MKKILTVVGARPQFIKAAAISHELREHFADRLAEDLLHTGQHYDDAMSARFFAELDLPTPTVNLGIGSAPHGKQTARMLTAIEQVLSTGTYDGLLVYGDTNSTLAGALAAAKMGVPVFHVEAGLRSWNRAMPEELNRVLTDHASTLLFAPTRTAADNLRREGIDESTIILSGDIMLDNALRYAPAEPEGEPIILATVHRDFNTDNPERLDHILTALDTLAATHTLLLPLHPRTRKSLGTSTSKYPHIQFCDPLSYRQTLAAIKRSRVVITDSGGLQKEAFFCGRGCVVLRPETEWTEIVDCGAAILADDNPEQIVSAARSLAGKQPPQPSAFGDGHAARHILDAIAHYF